MLILLVVHVLLLALVNGAQHCLLASNGTRPPPDFIRPATNSGSRFEVEPIQAIITSYVFNCSGVITEWNAYVSSRGNQRNHHYSIDFQVWRPNTPSAITGNDCYTIVGSNYFSNTELDPTNPRGLIRVTPPVEKQIEIQPGDVVGFYFDCVRGPKYGIQFAGDGVNGILYSKETTWYATSVSPAASSSCQFLTGTSQILSNSTNLAPLVTAYILISSTPTSTMLQTVLQKAPMQTPITTSGVSMSPADIEPSRLTEEPSSTPTLDSFYSSGLTAGILVSVLAAGVIIILLTVFVTVRKIKQRHLEQSQEREQGVYYSEIQPVDGTETSQAEQHSYEYIDSVSELRSGTSTGSTTSMNADYNTFAEIDRLANTTNLHTTPNIAYNEGFSTTDRSANINLHTIPNMAYNVGLSTTDRSANINLHTIPNMAYNVGLSTTDRSANINLYTIPNMAYNEGFSTSIKLSGEDYYFINEGLGGADTDLSMTRASTKKQNLSSCSRHRGGN